MDLIPSFSVDHTRIIPGIFTSRTDTLGNQKVTTYDVRVTRPNIEPAVDVAAMHSLEHIVATYLMLAAENEGLATLWVGSFDPALLAGILPSTDGYELVAMINVGYAAEGSAPSEKHWSRVEMGEFVTEISPLADARSK